MRTALAISLILGLTAEVFAQAPRQTVSVPTCFKKANTLAGFLNGERLRRFSDDQLESHVTGFINGLFFSTTLGAGQACTDWVYRCIEGRTSSQLAAILKKFLLDHPEWRQEPAHKLTWQALMVPCLPPRR